jgi:hypothetical protein
MAIYVSNHFPLDYAYNAGSSGRISVPVAPSQLVYSYFKNVAGAASPDTPVYSLDKLKILDTLIERLRSAKGQPRAERRGSDMTDERIDALIQQYGEQLHTALSTNALPYARPTGVVPGMLVSIAA